jgi:tRNA G18 (ribose-2'-O)-methylase SpoU
MPIALAHLADDPRAAVYANLKDAQLRSREYLGEHSLFIAESELVVRSLLASRYPVHSVLCTEQSLETLAAGLPANPSFPVFTVSRELMHAIVGFPFHRGVLAAGHRLPEPSLADVLASATSLTILEGVNNHDNVGGIFRNVAALGGERPALVLGPGCCDPLYRKAIRVSIGHVLHVPFTKVDEPAWPGALGTIREAGFTIAALTPSGATDLQLIQPPAKPALLLGAEGPGLTEQAMSHATLRVRIPMRPDMDSLNVMVAGAVAMSHLCRPPTH